jgi:heme oxygenase
MDPTTRSAGSPSAADALRLGTRARHGVLEGQLPIARVGADYSDYVQHIQALYGWIKPMNDFLWRKSWCGGLQEPVRAAKVALIEHDLHLAARLGLRQPAEPPICALLPGLTGLDAYAMGVAYVIEGSQLGGAVLAGRLPAGPAEGALSYLLGYGAATGSMWKQFQNFLNTEVVTPVQISQAVLGGCDAFDSLTGWMEPLFVRDRADHGH